jgi:hypothetical protein
MRIVSNLRLLLGCLPLLGVLACEEVDSSPPAEDEPEVVLLDPTKHLVRASVALRGTTPSIAELERVQQDPKQLEVIVDSYLESPEFGRTMRDMHSQTLQLRPDWLFYPAGFTPSGVLAEEDTVSINTSVMEAPLHLIEKVIMEDRPYTDIVTAPFAMANSISAKVWGLPYDPNGPDWQETAYEDGRGNAGILTDSWLYVRYQSTPSNANRARANAVSRSLLCYDFLSRDVNLDTDVDTADPNAVQAAVVENAACASCHQALDPLASFFKDFFPIIVPTEESFPVENMFFPGVFEEILAIDMRPPSYFGRQGESLEDLGQLIAEDSRFSACAAKRFYAYFNQKGLDQVPFERAAELQAAFIDSNYDAKTLAKQIVLAPDFASFYSPDAEVAEQLNGLRRSRPDELASFIEAKTGFVWKTELGPYTDGLIKTVELPRDSLLGYRVIGGGTDGQFVLFDTYTDTAASSLFTRAFAEEAATHVVLTDFALPAKERKLLRLVEPSTKDEATLRKQFVLLIGELHSELVTPDSEAASMLLELFQASMDSQGDPLRAHATVLTAMLQDIAVTYH